MELIDFFNTETVIMKTDVCLIEQDHTAISTICYIWRENIDLRLLIHSVLLAEMK